MSKDIENLQLRLQSIQEQFTHIEQAYKSLQASFTRIEAIYNFASVLSTLIELEDLFKFLKLTFSKTFKMEGFALILQDNGNGQTSQRLNFRLSDKALVEIQSHGKLNFAKLPASDKGYLYFDDLKNNRDFSSLQGSLLCLALTNNQEQFLATLVLHKSSKKAFPSGQREFFLKLAKQLAMALEKILLFEHTKELSLTDELTGIYNRRYFSQRFERELQRAKRYERPLAVLMLDIDHFKEYNDAHGHLKGDKAIKQVAVVLEGILRKADILARYGGEEFVILLPEASKEQARLAAQKLRTKIETENFPYQDEQPGGNLTISVGLAAFPEDTGDAGELLKFADEALYKAKARGRNCLAWHGMS